MFVHVEAHNSNFGEDVEDKPNIEGQEQVVDTIIRHLRVSMIFSTARTPEKVRTKTT